VFALKIINAILIGNLVHIKPNKDWKWNFCQNINRLTLEMSDDMVFVSAFEKRHLVNDAFSDEPMSVEQGEDFTLFFEKLEQQLPVPLDFIYQITLNCLVAKLFYKPLMPKSWFFTPTSAVSNALVGNVVKLQSTVEERHYVIVESNSNASTLLLIEKSHVLNDVKSLNQFEMIKVMNDRLIPVKFQDKTCVNAA